MRGQAAAHMNADKRATLICNAPLTLHGGHVTRPVRYTKVCYNVGVTYISQRRT
jgi:hypothetical protein